jgi:cysteine-rich repeat protein
MKTSPQTRAVATGCLIALASACTLAACSDAPAIDDMIYVDASPQDDGAYDAGDGDVSDARVDRDAGDALRDGGPIDGDVTEDAAIDAGVIDDAAVDASGSCATPCVPTGDCDTSVCVDGACVAGVVDDGELCRAMTGICVLGACVARACGDGYRESGPVPAREGCDDGNILDGDGCSSMCAASPVGMPGGVRYEIAAPTAGGPALAVDGTGSALAVWYTSADMGRVMGMRYDVFGAPVDLAPFVIEAPAYSNVAPVVAGRTGGGWAVAFIAGGVQLRLIASDATVGARQLVAGDGTAAAPDIVGLASGFVVAWAETHAGSDLTDPYDGIRARRFDDGGVATGAVLVPATRRDGNQQRATLAAIGDEWMAGWSNSPAFGDPGSPVVRGRRFRGSAAIDVADADLSWPGTFAPTLTTTGAGNFALAFETLGAGVDVAARRMPASDAEDIAWSATSPAWIVTSAGGDERLAGIAPAGDGDGIAVAYLVGIAAAPGIGFDGAMPGPELDALVTAWATDSVQSLALAPARRGVMVLWSSRNDVLRGIATRGVATMYVGVE